MSSKPYLRSGLVLFKRYKVGERLARGGFGEVYRATDLRIGREVALKYVFQSLDLETLRNEVSILARNAERLKFIPNIYDHWQGTGQQAGYFIVMEYVEGETLDKSRPLPWPVAEVIAFLRVVLRNLHDLHRSSIVHCDIKPVNIKATPPSDLSYQVPYRILDFGIAKQGDETTIQASSPHFAAPEQNRSGAARLKLDSRADLYSLAATAYYLLTERLPPDGRIRYENVYVHRYGDPLEPPSRIREGVPVALEETLLELLQIDRERRPFSAEVALQRLEQRLAAEAGSSASPASVEPRGHQGGAAAAAAPSAPHVTELTDKPLSTGEVLAARDITPAALPRRAVADREPPTARATSMAAVLLTAAPQAQAPAYDGPQLVELARYGRGVITCIAWAPDGQTLFVGTTLGVYSMAAQGERCDLWRPSVIPVAQLGFVLEGQAALIATSSSLELVGLGADQRALLWPAGMLLPEMVLTSPRGQMVATVSDSTLRVFNLGSGAEEAAWRLSRRLKGRLVALAADGQSIAIGDGDRLWCHRLQTGLREHAWSVSGLPQPLLDLALTPDGEVVAVAGATAVMVWTRGEEAGQAMPPEEEPTARIALMGDGQTIAVATTTRVRLRRTSDGKTIVPLVNAELAGVAQLAFCPHDRLLAAASADEIRIWRLDDGGLQRQEAGWAQDVRAIAPLPGGGGLVATGPRASQRWLVAGERLVAGPPLPAASGGPYAVAVSSGLERAAIAGAGDVRLADLVAGRLLTTLAARPAQAHCLAFRGDGAELCLVALDSVERYEVATGRPLGHVVQLDRRAIEHVVFGGEGRVAIASRGAVAVYGLDDGGERCTVQPRGAGEITAMGLSADGATLIIAHRQCLALWRVDSGRSVRLGQHDLPPGPAVIHLALAPDGASVAALRGGRIELWAVRRDGLELLGAASGHTGPVTAVAMLRGGLLASAARDGTLRLWRWPEPPADAGTTVQFGQAEV